MAERSAILETSVRPDPPNILIYAHEIVFILADPHGAADTAGIGVEPPVGIIEWVGRKGARWDLQDIGPIPGPPPPCGIENV